MLTKQAVLKSINDFIESASYHGIMLDKVLLFGSYAKGTQHKYSDIDLAVFSNQFTINHADNFKLIQFTKRIPQMQLHLYPVNEFMDNPFVEEIKKEAIEIV
jgi:predicted nucleotidyltransferase